MLFSPDEVEELKKVQVKDLYDDILELKNETRLQNLNQKNLINIEDHYHEQIEKLNKAYMLKIGNYGSKLRVLKTRRFGGGKHSDTTSQVYSSYQKDDRKSGF